MALRDKLIRILNEYGDIYDKVWRAQEFRDPLLDYFNADVKQAVQEIVQKYYTKSEAMACLNNF